MDVSSKGEEDPRDQFSTNLSYHPTDSINTAYNSNRDKPASSYYPSENGACHPPTHQMPALSHPDVKVGYSHNILNYASSHPHTNDASMLNDCDEWYSQSVEVLRQMPTIAHGYHSTFIGDSSHANQFAGVNQAISQSVEVHRQMPTISHGYHSTFFGDSSHANQFAGINQAISQSVDVHRQMPMIAHGYHSTFVGDSSHANQFAGVRLKHSKRFRINRNDRGNPNSNQSIAELHHRATHNQEYTGILTQEQPNYQERRES